MQEKRNMYFLENLAHEGYHALVFVFHEMNGCRLALDLPYHDALQTSQKLMISMEPN